MSNNIWWKDALDSGKPILFNGKTWTCEGAVCFWTGETKLNAHVALDKAAQRFAREAKKAGEVKA